MMSVSMARIEVATEVDLVANDADLAVLIAPGRVDPGIGDVGLHLALEERLHRLGEGDALGVAQPGCVADRLGQDGRRASGTVAPSRSSFPL
jgi:hypothetical protein